jgi:hypothetical protein
MRNLGVELLECLSLIKGNGSFVTCHSAPFVFPGLSIQGLGEIAYPINALQANALIQEARKAPYGKGSQTIFDDTVRSAWEIDAENLHFNGPEWGEFLQKALANIRPELGIDHHEVEAHLYKMLIYEKGDFFHSHRDTEKEKGMFGTLIIGLPSTHCGGELLVRFDGEEKSIHFAEAANNHKISYVAFYADCEHEIKPLTEGYRVCLVYNLVQEITEEKIRLELLGEHVSRLSTILKEGKASHRFSPGIILLGHQYTPKNLSREYLKLNDRTKAEAFIRAADSAGYFANMYYNVIADWLIGYNDDACFDKLGYQLLQRYFQKINGESSLLSFGQDHLQERVNNRPQSPANWSTSVPEVPRNARLWKILAAFLQSPVEQVFDFRRNQQERNELESAILNVEIDLLTETIKKGSPYTCASSKHRRLMKNK